MTREQIEKAAREYAFDNAWHPGETSYESDIRAMEESFSDAFMDGAQWRIAAAWHDTSERPKKGEQIVIQTKHGNFTSWFASDDIMDVFTKFETKRWAYVDDLLPDTRKEAEP